MIRKIGKIKYLKFFVFIVALGSVFIAIKLFNSSNYLENKSSLTYSKDCGPQALYFLLSKLNIESSVDEIRKIAETTEIGTSTPQPLKLRIKLT